MLTFANHSGKFFPSDKMNYLIKILVVFVATAIFTACGLRNDPEDGDLSRLKVVTTTTMLTDLVYQLCGDSVQRTGLMGAGVDPHFYKPTEGDVFRIYDADLIFYNGLHLEGRLVDLFGKMKQRGINALNVGNSISANQLIRIDDEGKHFDPHIWFSINNWKSAAIFVSKSIAALDAKNEEYYSTMLANYLQQLDKLEVESRLLLNEVPPPRRVLITAHDAFEYFGMEFGFEVIGLQGINTVSEAGAGNVRQLADLIVRRQIPAVFVESSVSDRNIRALVEAVRSRGFTIQPGGTLYSDALGSPGTPEGTYTGMYRHNVKTIRNALK